MKHIKNSEGMALLYVLLIVAIFFILGMTLFNFSITNAKQTQVIERDMKSVDIAEMGVVKYRNELIVSINKYLDAEVQRALNTLTAYNQNHPAQPKSITGQTILDTMKTAGAFSKENVFQLGFDPNEKFYIEEAANAYYTISEHTINVSASTFPSTIQLSFMSNGHIDGKVSKIRGEYTLELKTLLDENIVTSSNTSGNPTNPAPSNVLVEIPKAPTFTYEPPNASQPCSNTSSTNNCIYTGNMEIKTTINNQNFIVNGNVKNEQNTKAIIASSNMLINGTLNITQPFEKIHDATIRVTENGTFSTSEKSITNSNLFFEKNLSMDNMNSQAAISGSNFAVFGTAQFKNIDGGLLDTKMYFAKTASFDQLNSGIHSSILYTVDNLSFSNVNKGIVSSTIYSGGHLTLGQINNGGIGSTDPSVPKTTIFAKGNINGENVNTNISNAYIYAGGNLAFGNFNASISHTTIHVGGENGGNFSLKSLDGQITNSIIYVEGNLVVDNANNADAAGENPKFKNTLICVTGEISKDKMKASENGVNRIYSKSKNPEAYAANCPPAGINTPTTSTPIPSLDQLLPDLYNMMDQGEYRYE